MGAMDLDEVPDMMMARSEFAKEKDEYSNRSCPTEYRE